MAYEFVNVERKDKITIVTINRPDNMNAVHPLASKEMSQVWNDFDADPDQWIAILTGAGDKAFSAGNDLKWQAQNGGEEVRRIMKDVKGGLGGLCFRTDLYKPVIAAVNGYALGGGFEMALSCDIIIASEQASFGLPEPTVGLIAGAGGVHRLPRQIPYHLAMGMILTARRVPAQEAKALGIVNEVVPHADLLPTAEKWAERILAGAPISIRASKEAALKGLAMPLDQAIATRFPLQEKMLGSEDFIEGPKAFAEKRKPVWKGK